MNDSYKSNCGIGTSLYGLYKVQVVDATTKEIEKDYSWGKNLILNSGMNAIATQYYADLNRYGAAGTGSRPNYITGGLSTITQSGDQVFLFEVSGLPDFTSSYSTYTASVNAGDMLKYSNNSESMVTAIIDGFNLQVTPSYNIDEANSQSFTIWKTSQSKLEKETSRTSTLLTGAGNCGTSHSGSDNWLYHLRTLDFDAETSQKDYTEVGVSWLGTDNANIASRIVLPAPVTVGAGKQLRLVHKLYVRWEPTTPQYFTASITGWPVAPSTSLIATQSLQNFSGSGGDILFAYFGLTGGIVAGSTLSGMVLEPAYLGGYNGAQYGFVSPSSASLEPFNSAANRTSGAHLNSGFALVGYNNNSFVRYKRSSFNVNSANIDNIRSIGFGWTYLTDQPYSTKWQCFTVVFDEPQAKTDLQTMEFTWRYSWARVLE